MKITIVRHGTATAPLIARIEQPASPCRVIPSAAPIKAVMTDCDESSGASGRVIPTARSMPITCVRSNTVKTSVSTIPNRRR